MTSATDRLRELLDERGVKLRKAFTRTYKWAPDEVNHYTHWESPIGICSYHETVSDSCPMTWFEVASGVNVTPEQAIEATLGRTCEDIGAPAYFKCSECEWVSTVFAFGDGMPQYCPCCGRKVER